MSSFALKMIAIFTMFLDHLGLSLYRQVSLFNYIGRLSFPIFAFQISQGYIHTKNFKKYLLRLTLFAIISQIPFIYFRYTFSNAFLLNIFFTLILGLLSIKLFDIWGNKFLGFVSAFLLALIGELIHVDYGFWGVFVIFLFYFFRDHKVQMAVMFVLSCVIKYAVEFLYTPYYSLIWVCLATTLSIIPILLYNQKQGRKVKYFLYLFYPIHLGLLYCLSIFLH